MGKPRLIILIRHAQSEGNKNRDIHQFIPDHRVKLTPHGWSQAEDAGRHLRSLLKPDDTLHFFTSPYRRTRETTEGILRTLTADDPAPSPFPRNKITVFEEPRLREQDFGNFQPCSAEMERMWQERADYGHFFYRIPDGESAADAYDRVSGFNESLWRQFGDDDFPSVCVLVTHGLMSRVFLMKWYHWSVEYFEDLRNVNHCEFIMMKRSEANQKYILQNELRTWSELRKRAAAAGAPASTTTTPSRSTSLTALTSTPTSTSTSTSASTPTAALAGSPTIPVRRWGGCVNGCNHDKANWPKRPMRKNTMEFLNGQLPPPATSISSTSATLNEEPDPLPDAVDAADGAAHDTATPAKLLRKHSSKLAQPPNLPPTPASPNDASADASTSDEDEPAASAPRSQNPAPRTAAIMRHLQHPSHTGEGFSDDSDYFPGMQHLNTNKSRFRASSRQRQQSKERKLARRQTEQSWKQESGMGHGARADALGDGDGLSDDAAPTKGEEAPTANENVQILPEALTGDMIVKDKAVQDGAEKTGKDEVGELDEAAIDRLQEQERKGLGEVY